MVVGRGNNMVDNNLEKSVQYLKGVGPKIAEVLSNIGITTTYDILTHYPRSYEDRTAMKTISEFVNGENVLFVAEVVSDIKWNMIRRNFSVAYFFVEDITGPCKITMFNRPYIKGKVELGQKYAFYGKAEFKTGRWEIVNPEMVEESNINKIQGIKPIYRLTKGITNSYIESLIKQLTQNTNFKLPEIFSDSFRKKYDLADISYAFSQVHSPDSFEAIDIARKRHIFEELYLLELALMSIKKKVNKLEGIKHNDIDINKLIREIPFELTNAQKRAVNEICKDMNSDKVMNRLIQGDVGSGKTIVAAIAMYIAVKNGFQTVMMAPTTILANQHYNELKGMFEKLNVKVEVLTGKTTKKQKQEIQERIKNGDIDILFGTHAVLEDNIEFKNLSLVVTDEQQRFGVEQRNRLNKKSLASDVLVMTATPIPRTLALTIYSDLDISVIDELPKGRQVIKTYAVNDNMKDRINVFIKKEIDKGRQVYVVCPLVEENEESDLKAAKTLYEEYQKGEFSKYLIGFIHGKMKGKEKDEIMNKFKDGEINILIATTVIEVGINVPNATIMVVENSERFGLSSLHQLRGRVGRGSEQSYCILKTNSRSQESLKRLKIMEDTIDGFEIAAKDLEMRGPGDFFGTMQHGLPEFKLADLLKDISVLKFAVEAAKETVEKDPMLNSEENLLVKEAMYRKYGDSIDNIKS